LRNPFPQDPSPTSENNNDRFRHAHIQKNEWGVCSVHKYADQCRCVFKCPLCRCPTPKKPKIKYRDREGGAKVGSGLLFVYIQNPRSSECSVRTGEGPGRNTQKSPGPRGCVPGVLIPPKKSLSSRLVSLGGPRFASSEVRGCRQPVYQNLDGESETVSACRPVSSSLSTAVNQ
jgi:hypothetical protein